MNIPAYYFTSDLHLGHANIIEHDGRPFDSIEQHDAEIAGNLRPIPKDKNRSPSLWILGDVGHRAKDVRLLLERIRPYWHAIHLIRGNHDDKAAWKLRDLFDTADEAKYVRITPELRLYLSHYPMAKWRNSQHGAYHIHGHSHGQHWGRGRMIDVGINCQEYRAVSLEDIHYYLMHQTPEAVAYPHNLNLLADW